MAVIDWFFDEEFSTTSWKFISEGVRAFNWESFVISWWEDDENDNSMIIQEMRRISRNSDMRRICRIKTEDGNKMGFPIIDDFSDYSAIE